ncbi:hypothetical protein ACFL6T_02805 [Candidatus Zixiibacteriota bacterium]
MRPSIPFVCALFLAIPSMGTAQNYSGSEPFREYRFLIGNLEEVELFATTGKTLNNMLMDVYFRGLSPKLPAAIEPFTEIGWSVFWTFMTTMWPHDGGHWARAQQLGGDFRIMKFRFPFPEAVMIPPPGGSPVKSTLTSIAGFEVNGLMTQRTHAECYRNGFTYADELIHSFINQVQYPFYAFLLKPANPEEPTTWTDTQGDPVESILSTYEWYTNRPAIRGDGTVDPELIRQYRETTALSLIWTVLDPMFWQSLKAFGADMDEEHGLMRPRMQGSDTFRWAWGTQFHASPLGYELYLRGYLHFWNQFWSIYLKGGRPYRNTGFGISLPALLKREHFTLGVTCDFWNQAVYGTGTALTIDAEYRFPGRMGLLLRTGWKNNGYLIGRRLEQSSLLLAGFNYRL